MMRASKPPSCPNTFRLSTFQDDEQRVAPGTDGLSATLQHRPTAELDIHSPSSPSTISGRLTSTLNGIHLVGAAFPVRETPFTRERKRREASTLGCALNLTRGVTAYI